MAIKSVNAETLATYVAEKRQQGDQIATHEDVARIATAEAPKAEEAKAKPDPKGVAETVSGAPEPQGENPYKKADKEEKDENPFAKRIKELTRDKRELEEFAEGEYSGRLSMQRRVEELEAQIKATQQQQQKVEEDPEPDPAKYSDNKLFLTEWGAWNRRTAVKEAQAAEAKRRSDEETQRVQAELNARSQASVAAAKQEFPDFDERMKRSPVPWQQLPPYFRGVVMESEFGAHILYSLLEDPADLKRVLGLRPGALALEIGRLEAKFTRKEPVQADTPKGEKPVIPQPKAPAPMPSLNGAGGGEIVTDFSKPMPFKDYQRRRMDEIRRKRGH